MKELPVQEHELQPLAAHVRNEYDAVRVCTTGGINLYASDGDKAMLRDLLVTALNVHERNLVAFFDARRPKARPDDVYATDYTTSWHPERHGGVDLVYLQTAFLPGVHKRLAHLTARRVRVDADLDAVPLAEIYVAIAGMMERFLELLPAGRRSWFDRGGEPPDTSVSALFPS